jgi:drug/metabolite transporter (DMT)-like permease
MAATNKGVLFAVMTVVLWSSLGAAFKLTLPNFDGFIATLYIGFFTLLSLFIYLIARGKVTQIIPSFMKNKWFFIIAGIIGLGIQQVLYIKAYELLPATQVVIVFYIYPLLMVLLSHFFFKEHTSIKSFLLVFLGFIGVYISITNGKLIIPSLNLGLVLTLLGAFSWALFSVMIKHKKFDVDVGMFLFNLFGLIFLLFFIPMFGFVFPISAVQFSGILFISVISTAIPFIMWNNALQMTKTSICSSVSLLTPFASILWVMAVIPEKVTVAQIIGLVIIVGSAILNVYTDKNTKNK